LKKENLYREIRRQIIFNDLGLDAKKYQDPEERIRKSEKDRIFRDSRLGELKRKEIFKRMREEIKFKMRF